MNAPLPPLHPPARLLMGSGPSNPEARVLRALASPPIAAADPALATLVEHVTTGLQRVFCAARSRAHVVAGASRAGIEAVLASAIEPGDRVLIGAFGHFGELLCNLAERHGAEVARIDAEWGQALDPRRVVAEVRRAPPKLVAIVHADTSTGILQPLDGIGAACHEAGSLLVVDAVLSLGGCELRVDDWQVDAAIGGVQKCLGGPPGLAPLVISERLVGAMRARQVPAHSRYLDLLRPRWPSSSLLFGLREALAIIEEEGLEPRWQRHRLANRALRAGIQAMGLSLFGNPDFAAPTITLVRVPAGASEAGVREQLLIEHGVEIMAAFGPLRGRVWRIGTMGTNACLPSVLRVLAALEAVLSAGAVSVPRGAAIDAARAVSGPC